MKRYGNALQGFLPVVVFAVFMLQVVGMLVMDYYGPLLEVGWILSLASFFLLVLSKVR